MKKLKVVQIDVANFGARTDRPVVVDRGELR